MRKLLDIEDDDLEQEIVNEPQVTLNEKLRTINLFGDNLSSKVLLSIKNSLEILEAILETDENKDNRVIKIYICTSGGDSDTGLAIYDLLRSKARSGGLLIETIAIGEVASAGIVIFLAGDRRLIHENALLLSHATDQSMECCSRQEKENTVNQMRLVDGIYRRIILQRTKLSSRLLAKFERLEKYITAEEAVRYGLAHEIIKNH